MQKFFIKATKFFFAVLLLPLLPAAAAAIWHQALRWNERTIFLENPLSLCLGGLVLWACFALFYRLPSRVYVFAHELTHALFVKVCGGRIKKISVRKASGYIVSDADNFLITLAPYMFPFYALLLGLAAALAALFVPLPVFQTPLWVAIGVCLGYHFTMAGRMLTTRQSDFASQGYFFSFVLVLLANLLLILLLLLLLPSPHGFLERAWDAGATAAAFYAQVWSWLRSQWPA